MNSAVFFFLFSLSYWLVSKDKGQIIVNGKENKEDYCKKHKILWINKL